MINRSHGHSLVPCGRSDDVTSISTAVDLKAINMQLDACLAPGWQYSPAAVKRSAEALILWYLKYCVFFSSYELNSVLGLKPHNLRIVYFDDNRNVLRRLKWNHTWCLFNVQINNRELVGKNGFNSVQDGKIHAEAQRHSASLKTTKVLYH